MADQENNAQQPQIADGYGPRAFNPGPIQAGTGTPAEFAEDGTSFKQPEQAADTDQQGAQEGAAGGDKPQEGSPEGDPKPQAADQWTPYEAPTQEALTAQLQELGGFYAEAEYAPLAMEFETSFAKTGKGEVSEAAIQAYATAKNVDPSMVKAFIENANGARQLQVQQGKAAESAKVAAQEQTTKEFYEITGGEEGYKDLLEWAKTGLSNDQRKAFNTALDNDPVTAKVLLEAFTEKAKQAGALGGPRDVTQTDTARRTPTGQFAPKGFTSKAEMDAAFADPRYGTDDGFRAEVAAKMANSSF